LEMSELEDLSAKAARLWLEFMQAQAKAAASAAEKLPEVTRSLAEAGVPLAAEVSRWIAGALPVRTGPRSKQPEPAGHQEKAPKAADPPPALDPIADPKDRAAPPTRPNHRRLKAPKSLSRRRARRT
jgi:hypothetical protein